MIVCAHNEAGYIGRCLNAIFKALGEYHAEPEVIVICDRCTDESPKIAATYSVALIEKKEAKWKNSKAENLQMGLQKVTGELTAVVDADIELEKDYFTKLAPSFRDQEIVSVSGKIVTEPSSVYNFLYSIWEKSYDIINLGREPRGGARIYRTKELKNSGFKDVIAEETELDLRLKGRRAYLDNAIALHMRKMSLGRSIDGQIKSGRARRELNAPFWRVLLHSIVRLRPFVLYGYLFGRQASLWPWS